MIKEVKTDIIIVVSSLLTVLSYTAGAQDSLSFKGQLSVYTHFNNNNKLPLWSGIRYIPQINYEYALSQVRKLDMEASANIYGNSGLKPFDTSNYNGDIKPYRLWLRYSTDQLEIRAGLQKINFGSASLLRPLMWFDRLDPRDPLKLTDGVYGLLGRYYFLNNANLWLWFLYGNKDTKGWEAFKTHKNSPEFGGRFQTPVPSGEAGISFHHRTADFIFVSDTPFTEKTSENRFGFDIKFDMTLGWWIEGSLANFNRINSPYANQEIINIGADYTFGSGNGLTVVLEQLLASSDKKFFGFRNPVYFSLARLSYPIGMFDNLSTIIYYDWKNNRLYSFFNWQKQFNNISFYLMAYRNPVEYNLPAGNAGEMLYAGTGLQFMMIFNH